MSFAPSSVYRVIGNGSIIGSFVEKEYGHFFEFSINDDNVSFAENYPHKVWVGGDGYRYANVKKTVAYVIVDEDDDGGPILERWFIKENTIYPIHPTEDYR
jgi:hypothetical protein